MDSIKYRLLSYTRTITAELLWEIVDTSKAIRVISICVTALHVSNRIGTAPIPWPVFQRHRSVHCGESRDLLAESLYSVLAF